MLLTPREVASTLRVDLSTVYRWIERGTIGAVQFGGARYTVRIPAAELVRLSASPKPVRSHGETLASSPRGASRTVARERLPRVALLRLGGTALQPRRVLRQSNPVEARIISEWPWPSFFTAETTRTETCAPVRRQPKRDWLAEPPLWRLP